MRDDKAQFALKVVRRRSGLAAIVVRRRLDDKRRERLIRVAALSPLAFSAGAGLLRMAARANNGSTLLTPGPFVKLDPDWGAKVACYSMVCRGLRNADRMRRAAESLRNSDPAETAWWFGVMGHRGGVRAVRALRILIEAVK
ncbi:hypothetical protein FJY68_10720 [candidate division WOR-3 bacterium]|uniref:DUF7680 domain-containing protein n=1 Tax=candidate division WOR-3 bacterium TaxID=2052148 RepID=A0A937XGZ9_UNCW3|nr:hypothetical protein [candidate division WOR-3 bacterium]